MTSDTTTFSAQDQQELQALADRFAPEGLQVANNNLATLRARVNACGNDQSAKDKLRRDYLESHGGEVTKRDLETARRLMDAAHASKRLDVASKAVLDQAVAAGYITEEEAADKLHEEERRALHEARKTARGLVLTLNSRARMAQTFAATATDEERQQAMDAFNKDAEWRATLARFKELYASSSIQGKAQLRAQHPAIAQAALGR